uniref:Tubulin--tyrosine ligase-like protein 9 n=1 Tax=Ciona savignyi TaxID=51511 RepID=H2YY42_CIOSA
MEISKHHEETKSDTDKDFYIWKPDEGTGGGGIELFNRNHQFTEVNRTTPAVLQRYTPNPYLLKGKKVDLRLFFLISQINPTKIYYFKGGLVRSCTADYEISVPSNEWDPYAHLTNITLNQNSPNMDFGENGTVITYKKFLTILQAEGHNIEELENKIVEVCLEVLLSVIPNLMVWRETISPTLNSRCFQVVGLDLLLTSDLKPVFIELND